MKKAHTKIVPHSIRTHFGLLTSAILLSLLLVFYLGGRYILINIIRQAEKEITSVSTDIKKIIATQSTSLEKFTLNTAESCSSLPPGDQLTGLLKKSINPLRHNLQTHFAALLNPDGSLSEGYFLGDENTPENITPEMLARYFTQKTRLDLLLKGRPTPISGVIGFRKNPYYISIAPVYDADSNVTSFLVIGSFVQGNLLFKKLTEVSQGLSIYMNEKTEENNSHKTKAEASTGIPASIFNDDQLFAAGSNWHIGGNEFEAVIPIFDILGNEISSLSIRFPRSFSSLTTIALGWLTAFVAVVGIIFIAPIFWLQSRIILDPLSKLEVQIRNIGKKYKENRIEYLDCTSEDEFGRVARSVNTLLMELNSKSIEIAANAHRHKALIASIPDCLCVFNEHSTLVSIEKQPDNVTPISGLEPNRQLSPEYFKNASIIQFENGISKAIKTGRVTDVSLVSRESNTILRYFEARITRMDNHFALVVFRDVTKDFYSRKKQEKIEAHNGQAKQMSTLGNLAASIAHDFNNILTIIKNTLEVNFKIKEHCEFKEVEAIGVIWEATSRGGDLVQELITYAGQADLNLTRVNPVEVISKLNPLYKGVMHPSINLEISHGENLHDVMVDSAQFWKVIVNLVKNAAESIKSTRGFIKISTFNYDLTKSNSTKFLSSHPLEPDRGVVFEVSDNGAGINIENKSRLFEPFFSTKEVNRGLGLATVFGIVDSHNGGVNIISHENIGTKFRIWLPAAEEIKDQCEVAEQIEETGDEELSMHGTVTLPPISTAPCILIIDDDPSIIKTTELLLNRMGLETITAISRTEAAARFRKYKDRVDLILMDAQLGNLDSVRLLSTLRMCRADIPVVICSGHSKEKVEHMFSNYHIDGILIKPYTIDEFRDMLSNFVKLENTRYFSNAGDN